MGSCPGTDPVTAVCSCLWVMWVMTSSLFTQEAVTSIHSHTPHTPQFRWSDCWVIKCNTQTSISDLVGTTFYLTMKTNHFIFIINVQNVYVTSSNSYFKTFPFQHTEYHGNNTILHIQSPTPVCKYSETSQFFRGSLKDKQMDDSRFIFIITGRLDWSQKNNRLWIWACRYLLT